MRDFHGFSLIELMVVADLDFGYFQIALKIKSKLVIAEL